jgi:hypothetical protein
MSLHRPTAPGQRVVPVKRPSVRFPCWPASESNEHQDIIRTMYVRWGLALSQSFERVHSNEPVLRLPDVSMFGLAASTVLHGGFGLSAIHGDVRPLEEALEIMLQV